MITSLQFLRFVAASLVVLHHSIKEFSGTPAFGEFGVDIFFVISGFIISHITQDHHEQFFTRRLIRIVPLYWMFTGAIAVIAYLVPYLLVSVKWDVSHAMASLVFVPWWMDILEFEPLLPMGWTLNYEIWFYVLFYVAMRITFLYREVICALLIVGVYVLTNLLPLDRTASLSFYANSIVLEFIVGMAIAIWYRNKKDFFDQIPDVVVLFGVVAAFGMFYYTTYVGHVNVSRSVYSGLPAGVCVMACLCIEGWFKQCRPGVISAVLIGGEISYPLYLLHMFVIAALSRVVMASPVHVVEGFLLALLLSGGAAYVMSQYVDKPVRRMLSAALLKRCSLA